MRFLHRRNYLLECSVIPAILADRLQLHRLDTLTIEAKRLMTTSPSSLPKNLEELRASGWTSRTVKQEIYKNFIDKLALGEPLYPGIVGYDDTVVPELKSRCWLAMIFCSWGKGTSEKSVDADARSIFG